jgi:TRAP-type mannitol/chloroaromatic compound transport system permease large subunit
MQEERRHRALSPLQVWAARMMLLMLLGAIVIGVTTGTLGYVIGMAGVTAIAFSQTSHSQRSQVLGGRARP